MYATLTRWLSINNFGRQDSINRVVKGCSAFYHFMGSPSGTVCRLLRVIIVYHRTRSKESWRHLLERSQWRTPSGITVVLCFSFRLQTFVLNRLTYAWFPPFRCRSSVAVSPFPLAVAVFVARCRCRCRCVYFCRLRVERNGIFLRNFYRTTEFYNGRTAKRQRKNGDGMVESGH